MHNKQWLCQFATLRPNQTVASSKACDWGDYFRQKGPTFDAVLTGTLRRQLQTYAGPQTWPALP